VSTYNIKVNKEGDYSDKHHSNGKTDQKNGEDSDDSKQEANQSVDKESNEDKKS
jgi:hypothetical protein